MGKITDKVRDFIGATEEETIYAISESNFIPEGVQVILENHVSDLAAEVIGGLLAGALPRINGIRLNYKEKRFERNVRGAMIEFNNRLEFMDERMAQLDSHVEEKFRELYVEWLLDSLENEKQGTKVPYFVNGYIAMMNNMTNDDLMIMFFSTLNDLTDLDIDVLKMYHYASEVNIYTLIDEKHLTYEQIDLVKEKLLRNGLLESKNDEQRDANLDEVVRYISELAKQMKVTKPKEVKAAKTKKISRSESYKITLLGRNYLEMIGALKG